MEYEQEGYIFTSDLLNEDAKPNLDHWCLEQGRDQRLAVAGAWRVMLSLAQRPFVFATSRYSFYRSSV